MAAVFKVQREKICLKKMYNGSALLVNCFCGHCVIFPYPRIPEPADGPADALFPAQRSVASGGHKRIRISVFLCRFSFLHTALSLLVPSQADNSRCLLPRYFPRNGCLPRGRFSSMPAMLFHRETFTCPAEREKAFKEYKRLFGLCHWPGCKHDVFWGIQDLHAYYWVRSVYLRLRLYGAALSECFPRLQRILFYAVHTARFYRIMY